MYIYDKSTEGKYGHRRNVSVTKCDIRLDAEENRMLDQLSERNGATRSDIMRRALRDYWRWNSDGAKEV